MTNSKWLRGDESGFTLVELLVVIGILGIISFVLTESIIVGLKTTDRTGARVSGSVATQALSSYFSGDAQSADQVSTSDVTCATRDPSSATASVFMRLDWVDQGIAKTATYGLEPVSGREQDLVRWSCVGSAPASFEKKVIGHFNRSPSDSPVSATCAPTCSGKPTSITLTLKPDPSSPTQELEIRRRTP